MIGSIAAILTTFAFLPQVVRLVKTKDTESIALGMYVMQVIGIALWLAHGLHIGDLPLILANSVSFLLSGIILIYKLKTNNYFPYRWGKIRNGNCKRFIL